jgi:hypothetical protein
MAKQSEQSKLPKQFGMFYPRGYVVLAFHTQDEAERVWQLLVDGGYDEDDVRIMDRARVLEGSSGDLEHLSPLIKAFGSESDILESHKAGAESGQTFLIAYAPSELDTQRLMNVARRVGYVSAQKYDRFTFTKL